MTEDFYDLLDIPPDASQDEIKEAYREKVRVYHPDVNDDDRARAQFTAVKKAHEILGDPVERRAYDRMGHKDYVAKRTSGIPSPDVWTSSDSNSGSDSGSGGSHSSSRSTSGSSSSSTSSASSSRSSTTGSGSTSRSRTGSGSTSSGSGSGTSSTTGAASTSRSQSANRTAGTGTGTTTGTATGSTGTGTSTGSASASAATASGGAASSAGTRNRSSAGAAASASTSTGTGDSTGSASRTSTRTRARSDDGSDETDANALVRWWRRQNFSLPLIWLSVLVYAIGLAQFALENESALATLAADLSAVGADPAALWETLSSGRHGIEMPATFIARVEPVAPPLPPLEWYAVLAGIVAAALAIVLAHRVGRREDTWGKITIDETILVALAVTVSATLVGGPLLAGAALMPLLFAVIVRYTRLRPGWKPSYLYVAPVLAPAVALGASTAGYASLPSDLLAFVVLPFAGALGLPLRATIKKHFNR